MLSKILSTAILTLVAWVSVQLVHTQQALESAQANFHSELAIVRADMKKTSKQSESVGEDVIQRMEELSAEQIKIAKTAAKTAAKGDPKLLKAKDQKIARLNQTASLQAVVMNVLKADLLTKDKQGEQAAELLLATKSSIWKLSGKWAKNKDALRGLMAPIDILAGRWKRGDYSGDTKPILQVLQDVLDAQAQS